MFDNLAASRLVTLLAIVAVGGCSAASTNRYESLRQRAFTGVEKSSDETVVAARPGREAWAETVELSLAALRSLAVARNPSLAAMRAAWQAAVERYPQVVALDDPQIGYSLAPATVASGSTSFGQKIEVSQHFPWPGKLRLRGEAALGRVEVAGDDFEDARQHLLQSVAHTFYAYQFVHRALAINRAKQELLVEFRRVAEGRYAAGLASKSDALQAEVEHQYVVHGAIVLERERAVIRARLNTLLNLPPRDPLPPPPIEIAAPAPLPTLGVLEEAALAKRPLLRALAHSVRTSSAAVELARREFFPDFSVNAGYNSLWDDHDKRALVGVAINLPIQLERRRAALSETRAELRRAEARLEQEKAKTLLQLSEAYDGLAETRHVIDLYGSSILPAARESLASARAGYESTANDFLTLIATEKALYDAELTYQQALAVYHQRLARLEYAAGTPLAQLETTP